MCTFFPILAEIFPPRGVFMDYSHPPAGQVMAVVFFLLLLCVGMVMDLGLVVYFMKRPARPSDWGEALKERALPGRLILMLVPILAVLYVSCSMVYLHLFPNAYELEPFTLIFQALFFHLPALLILAGVFFRRRRAGHEPGGTPWRRAPALLGLSILLYLAAFPILWFYSALYQFFLYRLGIDLYLQEVAEIFLMPAPMLERIGMYLTAILIAPLFEEILFRGVLLPWAVRRAGFWPGIALVSVLFAGMHFHLPSFLPLLLLSVIFCVAYARTRSLLVPIGMHACFNAVTVILLSLMG